MRPACDRVLCEVFNVQPDQIKRFKKGEHDFILDTEFHIDLKITLKNNSQVTGQEKALSHEFYKFRTFTMEFYQNWRTKEPGEFFKIASQFYLHGYSDKTGFEFAEWKIIDLFRLIYWLRETPIERLEAKTRRASGSRASFLWMDYDKIPQAFIVKERLNPPQDVV